MKKTFALALMGLAAAILLTGCGSEKQVTYRDGAYTGTSSVYVNDDGTEDGNGYGVATVTIENGAITACTFQTFETDGTLKDTDYGKEGGEIAHRDYYNKAQKAVAACDEYAAQLVSAQKLSGVDAISGATVNYTEFKEAVTDALNQAAE